MNYEGLGTKLRLSTSRTIIARNLNSMAVRTLISIAYRVISMQKKIFNFSHFSVCMYARCTVGILSGMATSVTLLEVSAVGICGQ